MGLEQGDVLREEPPGRTGLRLAALVCMGSAFVGAGADVFKISSGSGTGLATREPDGQRVQVGPDRTSSLNEGFDQHCSRPAEWVEDPPLGRYEGGDQASRSVGMHPGRIRVKPVDMDPPGFGFAGWNDIQSVGELFRIGGIPGCFDCSTHVGERAALPGFVALGPGGPNRSTRVVLTSLWLRHS